MHVFLLKRTMQRTGEENKSKIESPKTPNLLYGVTLAPLC
uniref:Uncharacterized protein n=1 Tax=Rhizophora mucronata TaxID=61149 RepID=A0A2P2P5E8_RHIMU